MRKCKPRSENRRGPRDPISHKKPDRKSRALRNPLRLRCLRRKHSLRPRLPKCLQIQLNSIQFLSGRQKSAIFCKQKQQNGSFGVVVSLQLLPLWPVCQRCILANLASNSCDPQRTMHRWEQSLKPERASYTKWETLALNTLCEHFQLGSCKGSRKQSQSRRNIASTRVVCPTQLEEFLQVYMRKRTPADHGHGRGSAERMRGGWKAEDPLRDRSSIR